MRILILNWRCPRHPRAGGAEYLTHQIAKRLAASGHQVEWFSAGFPGANPDEWLDGIHIVRAGRQWTVHVRAFLRYFRRLRARFDVVIDEVNTIPFFTPLWADIPSSMLIYQLAREVWWYESPFPINLIGYLLEPLYLRIYKRTPILTESASTLEDLRRVGLRGAIAILPVAVDTPVRVRDAEYEETSPSTFLYVGRLSPSKRVMDIIRAFHRFRITAVDARLQLIGSGPTSYVKNLRKLVHELNLDDAVDFCGAVSTAEKYERMSAAYALIMASVREGWGLVVTEANLCGTPAIGYDVPGLRDSIRHERTGLLVTPNFRALSAAMVRLWDDRALHKRLSREALSWSRSFSYERSADIVRTTLEESLLTAPRSSWAKT